MGQSNDKNESLWESQYARLGSFLIASSFLVATFVQLVTADKETNILVHAVAALGCFIAALYFFMNFWLAMPNWLAKHIRGAKSTGEQILHTWLVPLSFLAFWLVVWIAFTNFWFAILLVLVFFMLCLGFQTSRYKKVKE
ncbi:hypothetical protein ACFLVW_06685 [Chloroflexota bacterium]